jgi:hypothetical protein
MAMPPQLARAQRRRPRNAEPRPIVELTPHIDIHDLCRWNVFPRDWNKAHILEMPFRYPFIKTLVISRKTIEINLILGYTERVALHWVRTGFGKPRPIFVCGDCRGGARRLFFRGGHLACRHCHGMNYASQQRDRNGRKRLGASKLRLKLGGLPDINEPIALKPKWTHRKTYQHIRNRLHTLETSINSHRFKNPFGTKILAYYLS